MKELQGMKIKEGWKEKVNRYFARKEERKSRSVSGGIPGN